MSDRSVEDKVLEQLNQQIAIKDLLETAIDLISQNINQLMLDTFSKEKHAKKFVIPSLIGHKGPLNDLSVKLKLLYALGNITREEYEDIELLMAILDELDDEEHVYTYTDDEILGPISLLYDMVLPPNLPLKSLSHQSLGIVDSMKSSIYASRYQQVVRSALIIAITDLIVRVNGRIESSIKNDDD